MSGGQYRALVAYLYFWTPMQPRLGLDQAMSDIGIAISRDAVIAELARAGHCFDEETGLLTEC